MPIWRKKWFIDGKKIGFFAQLRRLDWGEEGNNNVKKDRQNPKQRDSCSTSLYNSVYIISLKERNALRVSTFRSWSHLRKAFVYFFLSRLALMRVLSAWGLYASSAQKWLPSRRVQSEQVHFAGRTPSFAFPVRHAIQVANESDRNTS